MATIEINVDLRFVCDCGQVLDYTLVEENEITIAPCPKCLKQAVEDAIEQMKEEH